MIAEKKWCMRGNKYGYGMEDTGAFHDTCIDCEAV
jgi:hypothetical protein